MKKVLAVLLSSILLLSSATPIVLASSAPKEEVVYGLLNPDGSVENLYVVNIFDGGNIIDYGTYSKLSNLTDKEALTYDDNKIFVNTKADKFYYQGYLVSKDLPWNIAIKYYLDDKELSPQDLAGKSGRLRISISVNKNPAINSSFYDNFGLQIGVLLNNKLSSNIEAENATIAEAAGSKQISYTVLPGSPFEGTIIADVKDFEMEPITINGIRMAFDFVLDEDKLAEQFSELEKGLKNLDDGAGSLLAGLSELADGIDDYVVGLKAYKDGIDRFSSGAGDLYRGASALSLGLSELAKQNNNINNGADSLLNAAFDAINTQLQGMGLGLPVLTVDNYGPVLSNIPGLDIIKLQLDGVIQFVQGLKEYTQGVTQLSQGADELKDGINRFKESSEEIAASANALYDGAVRINSGIKELKQGMAAYKDGTKALGDGIDVSSFVSDFIDGIFGDVGSVISFVSDKNTDILSVQFVLKTAPIKLPPMPSAEVSEPVKLSFWQKLLRLFGL